MGGNVSFFLVIWRINMTPWLPMTKKQLDHYVEESGYSTTSMAVASTAIAFMQFAKTFTDMGRLGNGVLIEGGLKGVGKDVLRVLNLVGTAGFTEGSASL